MKAFLDTSVLVPVFYEDHENHEASFDLFAKLEKKTGATAAHSLAEVYSSLTRMPGKRRVSGEHALLFLENIRERLHIVALGADEYFLAIREYAVTGIVGGAIYDTLLARCALKAKADFVYTWNVRDFKRFGPEISQRVRTPAEA